MGRILWRIYVQPISMVLLEMVLLLVLWGVMGKQVKNIHHWKLLNTVVFLGIVFAILFTTLFSRAENPQEPVWIPLYSFVEAKAQPERYRSTLMNAFLFQPLGLSLPNVLPRKAHPVVVTIVFAMLLSIAIEATQLFYGLGQCEVDDVILNTLGAVLGTMAYGRRVTGRKSCKKRNIKSWHP